MQEICSSNPPVVTGICDPKQSWAPHHHSLMNYLAHENYENHVLSFLQLSQCLTDQPHKTSEGGGESGELS